jgi:hypothetical protein
VGTGFSEKIMLKQKLARSVAHNGSRPPQHQSRPAIEIDAPLQRKLPVSRERGIGLRFQQTRQHNAAARRNDLAQRRGELLQRRKQDVGEDQIERGADANVRCGEPIGAADVHQGGAAIKPGIPPRDAHGLWVDIDRQHALAQAPRGGNRQHAGAGAEIEDTRHCRATIILKLTNRLQRDEAAARRAVMTGAEGLRRLDLDADPIRRHAAAIMAAVHDIAPRRNRL